MANQVWYDSGLFYAWIGGVITPISVIGVPGSNGLNGINGNDGDNGEDGFPGIQGIRGLTGLNGTGIPGIDGIDGDFETSILIGNQGKSFKRGSVIYSDGNNLAEDNSSFSWDIVNKRLGVGIAAPLYNVHVYENINGNVRMTFENPSDGAASTAGFRLIAGTSGNDGIIWTQSDAVTTYGGPRSTNFYKVGQFPFAFLTDDLIRLFISGTGHIGIGTKLMPSSGDSALVFGNGTIPSGMDATTAANYANASAAGTVELYGINGLGRSSQLTGYPGFFAYNSVSDTLVASGTTIDFNTEIYDELGNFATDTFTAPITGRYLFTIAVSCQNGSIAAQQRTISLVTSNRTYFVAGIIAVLAADNTRLNGSVIADMDAGDTAFVQILLTGTVTIDGTSSDMVTYFAGRLML